MKKILYFIFAFFLQVLVNPAASKVCQTGLGMPVLNTKMELTTCPEHATICQIADVTAVMKGITIETKVGMCATKEICEDTTCDSIERQVALQTPGASFQRCSILCDGIKQTTTTLPPGVTKAPVTTECLQGTEMQGFDLKLVRGPCDRNDMICVLYKIVGIKDGIRVDMKIASCVDEELCDPNHCTSKEMAASAEAYGVTYESCSVTCSNATTRAIPKTTTLTTTTAHGSRPTTSTLIVSFGTIFSVLCNYIV